MMEPIAYVKNCRIIDNGGKEYDSLRFASADDKRGFALVRLSDAEARIKALEADVQGYRDNNDELATAWASERARAEAAEALLKEARPLLLHLSRETTTDHIGDEWLTPTACAARAIHDKIGVKDE